MALGVSHRLTLMMAAPRCCTTVMNSPSSHSALSSSTSLMGLPLTVPWFTSGYCSTHTAHRPHRDRVSAGFPTPVGAVSRRLTRVLSLP